jgi:DNA (cytosine-5)-methyltransferase 1
MKFADLFAGIGGFHIALSNAGAECVFACDIDEECRKTYEENFGIEPKVDITKIDPMSTPNHDILCAGFPCQPFSVCGKQEGFKDDRGNLIFCVLYIVNKKNPKVVFLENVKHLKYHDQGKTLSTIISEFEKLGFKMSWKILNAKDYGAAQNREWMIMVANRDKKFSFSSLEHKPHLS